MNDKSNGERTDAERAASERMRELGRRSGEARRRKREQREKEQLEPLTDREQAMSALRRRARETSSAHRRDYPNG